MSINVRPTVSFIVPCYNLAHLLSDCIESILLQTYGDFEVLIMDDCSPDNTAEVAGAFVGSRVKHIRNEQNLGHLRNYNKGIALSRGKYVWLISADDYLRRPYVLERYVTLMEQHKNVGYVFCPGVGVRDGSETEVLGRYSPRRDRDRIFARHVLLRQLLKSNFVVTPSGMVRRECYEKVSLFDLSMPWCGDWYLWCLFAVYYDVGYFKDPMVCYRQHHDLSMTSQLLTAKLDACAAEEVAVAWAIRRRAQGVGHSDLATQCLAAIARTYARTMASERYRNANSFMNFKLFEESLHRFSTIEVEREYLRAHVFMSIGDVCYWQDELVRAKEFYKAAITRRPWMLAVRTKYMLLSLGRTGGLVRRMLVSSR